MNTNELRQYWLKLLTEAFLHRNASYDTATRKYYREWARHCLYQFWCFGGIGGNPDKAKKYFPKRQQP